MIVSGFDLNRPISIAFVIWRMNWFRVISSVIAESLRRGWSVECWYSIPEDGRLGDNRPCHDKAPRFEDGSPRVREFRGVAELRKLLDEVPVDVILDVDICPVALSELCQDMSSRPLTVLMDGISHSRLQSGGTLPRLDLYAVPSKWHIEETIRVRTRDLEVFLREAEASVKEFGKPLCEEIRKAFAHQWSKEDADYYREHSCVVGTPSFDDLERIDRFEVKKRFGIDQTRLVVGYLPSPYDMPLGVLWGDVNMSSHFIGAFLCAIRHNEFSRFLELLKAPRDRDIVTSIRKFCDKNKAVLIAKLRHSRPPKRYLRDSADIILGEDGYYPHTVLELFSIADVVFGFTSAGAVESIAAGASYVDIELPFFPKKFYTQEYAPYSQVTNAWKDVIWTMQAIDLVKEWPSLAISDFTLNENARQDYLNYFTSGINGNSSGILLDVIEGKLRKSAVN